MPRFVPHHMPRIVPDVGGSASEPPLPQCGDPLRSQFERPGQGVPSAMLLLLPVPVAGSRPSSGPRTGTPGRVNGMFCDHHNARTHNPEDHWVGESAKGERSAR